jgi:RNA polymerase sigma factor (sigma-70 family)
VTHGRLATAPELAQRVREAQAGDTAARDELIAEHLPLTYNIVGRALPGNSDVDDLVQETMLRAIGGLHTLRDPERFRSWLVAIAYRQIQLYLRRRKKTLARRHPEPIDVPDPTADFAERKTAELVVSEQRRDLARATDWLDDDDRRLLALWWQEAAGELSRAELAAALATAPRHAAVRVHRMKAQLDAARAIVRALRARPRCARLTGQLRKWNGVADPLWRKRLIRHVRGCEQCAAFEVGLVPPERLLPGIAALPVPATVLAAVHIGAPIGVFRHKLLAAAATLTVAAGGGLAYAVYLSPAPPGEDLAKPRPTVTADPWSPAPFVRGPSGVPATRASTSGRPTTGLGVPVADIYVAPDGSDTGPGSLRKPYASLAKAIAAVKPGQTIALRGGTYRPAAPISIATSGTAAKRIVLSNYRGEHPVMDASAVPADQWAVTQQAAYWTVQGLEVTGAPSHAWVCRSCHDDIFQRLSMHGNGRSGLMLRDDGTFRNEVLDSDFFDNRDPGGAAGVGIGLGIQFGSGEGNLVRGNRAYGNASDGFEFGFRSPVTVEYNWAFGNGANGFTFGGGGEQTTAAHHARHDAAWNNTGDGFTDESNTGALEIGNCSAFANDGTGFAFSSATGVLRNDVALDNGTPATVAPDGKASNNSWQEDNWSDDRLRSRDPSVAQGPRTPSGKLPPTAFLTTDNGLGASMSGD